MTKPICGNVCPDTEPMICGRAPGHEGAHIAVHFSWPQVTVAQIGTLTEEMAAFITVAVQEGYTDRAKGSALLERYQAIVDAT